ncbi:MAG: hypothetical protein JEY94_01450 [Melioribacteraceae bacterium]|nr:hypothetical protein [Melioribacteraceae bacterium]
MNRKKIILLILFMVFVFGFSNTNNLKLEDVKYSDYYSVEVNGTRIPLYYSQVAPIAVFTIKDEAKIDVSWNQQITKVEILPEHLGIKYKVNGNSVELNLKGAAKFYVKLNDNYVYPLVIIAHNKKDWGINKNDPNVKVFESDKVYNAGEIILNSNETIFIEEGAYVKGSIKAEDAKNIKVLGYGILEGTMYLQESETEAILIKNCKGVKLEGITSIDAAWGNLILENSDNISIADFNAFGSREKRMNDDGLDIVASKNVTVDNVFLNLRNNNIAIQANGTEKSFVTNVTVKNSVFWKGDYGNVFEFGYKTDGLAAENVTYKNLDVLHTLACGVFSFASKSGVAKNFTFENIRIEDARFKLFEINLNGKNAKLCNVKFKDIQLSKSLMPYSDFLENEGEIKNLIIENFTVNNVKVTDKVEAHFRTSEKVIIK